MPKLKHNLDLGDSDIGLVLLASHCGKAKYPDGMYAELATNKGTIVLQLETEKSP